MNTRLMGNKIEFAELLGNKNIKAAFELYEKVESSDGRIDYIYIATSLGDVDFLDKVFNSLHLFDNDKSSLHNLFHFAETKEHVALFFEAFKNIEVNNDGFLLDVATLATHSDNIMALRQVVDSGYIEKSDYSFHDGISYTLLEYASTVKAEKCTAYLIQKGFKANNPSQMETQCWAYPWPENVMLELNNWKFFLRNGYKNDDLLSRQSLSLLWINQHSPSCDVIKIGLVYLLAEDSFLSGVTKLKQSMNSVELERIKTTIEEIRHREFSSLSEIEVLILVILGEYEPKSKEEEGVYLGAREKFNFKNLSLSTKDIAPMILG